MATSTRENPKSILILRLSAIGDVVCTLPLLQALRGAFPLARIDWLVDEKISELLTNHPQLNEVLIFPRKSWSQGKFQPLREHFKKLRSREYDVALDVQSNLKSSLNLFFVRAKRKVGFAAGYGKEGSFLFVNERIKPPGKRIHRLQKNLSLLQAFGLPPTLQQFSPPPVDLLASQRVQMFLERDDLANRPLALLHPATSAWGRDKQWSPERFGALARKIAEELGLTPIITWGPGEKPLADHVASLSGAKARTSFETKSLKEFVALVSRAKLFIAGDTGALQIASFLERPTVGIFGPTDPVIYGPIGSRSAVAQPPDWNGPYLKRSRNRPSPLMEQVSVEAVFRLAQGLLETGSSA